MAELFEQKNKDLKTANNNLPANQHEAAKGLEEFDSEDLIIPRLQIAQGLSPAVVDGLVNMGDIINNLTFDVVGKCVSKTAKITVVPIMYGKSRVAYAPKSGDIAAIKARYPNINEKEIENKTTIICRSSDARHGNGLFGMGSEYNPSGLCADCKLKDWFNDSAPPCTFFRNVFCLVEGYDFEAPLVVSFGKTSAKAGKKFANLMNMLSGIRKMPVWEYKYELSSKFIEDGQNKYYIWDVRPAGKADDELKQLAEAYYDMLQSTKVKIVDDDEEAEDVETATDKEEVGF
jgi:hypothetical protein